MSIEQLQDFHQIRRILWVVAPEYVVLANEALHPGEIVLDVGTKHLEVGEGTDINEAVAALLFQIGHLKLRNLPECGLFFGHGVRGWVGHEVKLINRLAHIGQKVDAFAADWAKKSFRAFFPDRESGVDNLIDSYVWKKAEWRKYFSEK